MLKRHVYGVVLVYLDTDDSVLILTMSPLIFPSVECVFHSSAATSASINMVLVEWPLLFLCQDTCSWFMNHSCDPDVDVKV